VELAGWARKRRVEGKGLSPREIPAKRISTRGGLEVTHPEKLVGACLGEFDKSGVKAGRFKQTHRGIAYIVRLSTRTNIDSAPKKNIEPHSGKSINDLRELEKAGSVKGDEHTWGYARRGKNLAGGAG